MNIITVHPIIRGAFKDELTYWSSHSFNPGAIIEVPLRGRNIPALVGSIVAASHAKANIKQASFVTRKIEKSKEILAVHPACLKACEKVSAYYAAPLGAVLKSCIPDSILQDQIQQKEKDKNSEHAHNKSLRQPAKASIASDILVYQTNTADRLSTYKSIVREEFARKRSMLIVAPTVISVEELFQNLQKGIEDYVVVLHGGLSKKKQLERWKSALESDHPVLIITTPLFACIPKDNIQTIVIERESSRAYGSFRPPHIDFRDYIEQYAKNLGSRLIFGDTLLRVETLYRRERGELSDFFPISYRVEKTAELVIVNTSSEETKAGGDIGSAGNSASGTHGNSTDGSASQSSRPKKQWTPMSEELHSMIDYAGRKNERMFIFAARRGLSPQTICGDCGHTVVCELCKAPIVLHQKKSVAGPGVNSSNSNNNESVGSEHKNPMGILPNRFFLCHHCGTERSAVEACTHCGSWKLVTLGIGLETIAEEIKKQFPKREIFRLDKDSISTDKQAETLVKEFMESKTGILLGTESSLAFLPEVTYSAIASLDSLFSIPDFKINERIAHTILRILEKTTGHIVIQTRNPKNAILKHIESGNLLSMYREEISMRKLLNYPPFITHIKITVEDTKAAAAEKMRRLQHILEEWEENAGSSASDLNDFDERHEVIHNNNIRGSHTSSHGVKTLIFPAFVPGARGKSTLHMLLSVPKSIWPNNQLRGILASLPKEYIVKIDPESLL